MRDKLFGRRLAPLGVMLTLCSAVTIEAATRVWSGNVSGNWATAGNWSGGIAPQSGDILEFPAGVARFTTTNNFPANTEFNYVVVEATGYTFHGNALRLRGDNGAGQAMFFTMPNGNSTWHPDVALTGTNNNITFVSVGTAIGSILITGDVSLGNHELTIEVNAQNIEMQGAISSSGADNSVAVQGPRDVIFSGSAANTYSGATTVNRAQLQLNKTVANGAIPGDLFVLGTDSDSGAVTWLRGQQIANDATLSIGNKGHADLNGFAENVGDVYLTQSDFDLGGGTLSLSGNITSISGDFLGGGQILLAFGTHTIDVSGAAVFNTEIAGLASILKKGNGELRLNQSNTFTGTLTIGDGIVDVAHDFALGHTAGETVLTNGNLRLVGGRRINGETLSVAHLGGGVPTLTADCSSNVWSGQIDVDSKLMLVSCFSGTPGSAYSLTLSGPISGAGDLFIHANGGLLLTGPLPNSLSGVVEIAEGTVVLDKPVGVNAVANEVLVGYVFDDQKQAILRLRSSHQIPDNVRLRVLTNGVVQMTNVFETVGALSVRGAQIHTGTGGMLTVTDDINVFGPSVESSWITGRLNVGSGTRSIQLLSSSSLYLDAQVSGSADMVVDGTGYLLFRTSNSFTGTLTINGGTVTAEDNFALGSTTRGTVVNDDGALVLFDGIYAPGPGVHITNESLTLNPAPDAVDEPFRAGSTTGDTWAGPIVVAADADLWSSPPGSLTLAGPISGPGGLKLSGETFTLSGNSDNTFAGTLHVFNGTLRLAKSGSATAVPGEMRIGNNSVFSSAHVQSLGAAQIADTALLIFHENGNWNLGGYSETIGNLVGALASESGVISLEGGTLTVQLEAGHASFPGTITGAGGFTKRGSGTFVLAGDNTYTGSTLVQSGTLRIEGSQPASAVTVLNQAVLGGNGRAGAVQTSAGGQVFPASAPWAPLTTSNVVFNAGSSFRSRLVSPGVCDALNVRGTVALNGASLVLDLQYLPSVGDAFTLVGNDGAEAVSGTFAGLPGGTFTGPGGLTWEITYGNDVTLTLVSQGMATAPTGGSNYLDVVVLGGNGNGALDPNECADLLIPMFNHGGVAQPPFQVFLSSTVPGLIFNQASAKYPALAPGTRAYNLTPFQISTPTNFTCGTNLPVTAVVLSGTNAPFVVQLQLPTGKPGAPLSFHADETPESIPDGGTISNTLVVESFSGLLARVEVSVNIPHELTTDLNVTLVAPDGTEIPLVAGAGQGTNFGTGCADAQRTRFSMAATQFVGAGAAPFVGTFRPVGNLQVLRGRGNEDVEGKWNLVVSDNGHFNVGLLACWSMHLYPAVCEDGGGQCAPCPAPIAGELSNEYPVADGIAGDTSGTNTFCFSQVVGDQIRSGAHRFDRYAFTNQADVATCVEVSLGGDCTNAQLWAAAYIGQFVPTNVVTNFVGSVDQPPSVQNPAPRFSFSVPAQARFEVVVSEFTAGEGCKGYVLNVRGADICPVRLNIASLSTNSFRVDWPSHASGYSLERADALVGAPWISVTNEPVVSNGRLTVTNNVSGDQGFYRLRKP